MAQVLTLPDGRKLDYLVGGAEGGLPLVNIHGTPGSYLIDRDLQTACETRNIKLISLSRSGYGGSTRHHGRRIVDVVADIHALLEHLGHKECIVMGRSGGGPHALASAARLPGCLAVLCVCGVGPYGVQDLDFFAGFGQGNIDEYNATLQSEETITKFCEARRPEMITADPAILVEGLSSMLPEVDKKAILENEAMSEEVVQTIREALKHNVDGWVDDDLAFVAPWGFELSEIKVPVLLYQGDEDLMVPFGHGKWLAEHLPRDQVRPHLLKGEGHVSIVQNHLDAMLDEILSATAKTAVMG
ncbi:hypothetical protein M406DRAFT_104996 [Cryphonectria parasitica EP155]|uniref:AB hydrolase-1 domain-containing protein n=1 Tax=Cryphonectria parasitica (strain ATCC 38755 / EP155) TaxID=660469 RepID=A0A9P5CSG8_CRYP1|nr:uncharacterized protein M406DRAFT_104996 [Cryphonectria parasitica EP155]KAF3769594.1 hypothetical protein M406DRAFT_104996 [Cryphonectria parasitica EP155]